MTRILSRRAAARLRPLWARLACSFALCATLLSLPISSASAQESARLAGVVTDAATGVGIADVVVRVDGTLLSAVTNETGRFVINAVPMGSVTLQFEHLAYGTHSRVYVVNGVAVTVAVRLTTEAIELDEIDVVGQTTEQTERRARGASQWVVDRAEIVEALGTSRHLGDLIRQTIPGIRLRQSNNLIGNDVCIEFRAAASLSIVNNRACNSPLVYLDGVPTGNPTLLYGALSLETIEEIEMLPPGQAGARYGSGAQYGVMLITTNRPGRTDRAVVAPVMDRPLSSFDWDRDPAGHNTRRTALSAFAGSAIGLGLGLVAARQCIAIDEKDEVITTCSMAGTATAGLAAVAIPALGGALASRWGGGTDTSVGRIIPAAASAMLVLVPGYAFALSTQGGAESEVANVVGGTLLVVGVPALLTVADRLFRKFR